MGKNLFFQPYEGYHHGWNIFPLILAKNAVNAGAQWAPKDLLKAASEFIAAAKMAPFDYNIRTVLAQYREVQEEIEERYFWQVVYLSEDLIKACNAIPTSPNFRAEIAALFWTLGYVPQAQLMKADEGIPEYQPSIKMMNDVVDHCIRAMSEDSLMQYIWLEMKDRPPFDLRAHRELFTVINARFHTKEIHILDEIMPEPPSYSYAKVLIGHFQGAKELDEIALQNLSYTANLLLNTDPVSAIQIRSLMNLVYMSGKNQKEN